LAPVAHLLAQTTSFVMREGLDAVALPALLAGITCALAWQPWRRRGVVLAPSTAWACPLALGLGFLAGYHAIEGMPRWPIPASIKPALPYAAAAAAMVGVFEAGRAGASSAARLALSLGAACLFLRSARASSAFFGGDPLRGWIVTAGVGLALFLLMEALERLARAKPGPYLPFALAASTALAGGAQQFAGSSSGARLSFALAATLGAAGVIAALQRGFSLAAGAIAPFAILSGGLALAGYFSADLPLPCMVLLALAPLGGWVGVQAAVARMAPLARVIVSAGAILLPGATALAWTALQAAAPDGG
jgi:hypothetical protein